MEAMGEVCQYNEKVPRGCRAPLFIANSCFFFFYPSELYLQGGEGGRGVVEGEAEKSQKKEEPLGRNIGS